MCWGRRSKSWICYLLSGKKDAWKRGTKLSSPAEETIMRNRSHVFWTRKGYFCLELFNLNATKGKITRLLIVILSPLTISEYSRKVKGLVIESNQEVSLCWTKCGCGVSSSIVLWPHRQERESTHLQVLPLEKEWERERERLCCSLLAGDDVKQKKNRGWGWCSFLAVTSSKTTH